MKIVLEELKHQREAIDSIINKLNNDIYEINDDNEKTNHYCNPVYNINEKEINVKMETGTGKTYVYTNLMFELNKQYGFYKFIILTPSIAIKEGTKNFIKADYSKQHFRTKYGKEISLNIINSGSFEGKKNKIKLLPNDLIHFVEQSKYSNSIECLLINSAMLISPSMKKDDYDRTLLSGIRSPFESLKETKPIVIIDEPHRFKKDLTAYKKILELDPQLIIRFGATFPENEKNINYAYDLNAVNAFNQGLVKAVDIFYGDIENSEKYKIISVNKKELKIKSISNNKEYNIKVGEELSFINDNFNGLSYVGEEDGNFKLNNDLILNTNQILYSDTFSNSYQESMLKLALKKHFEIEKENFKRTVKIKTLSLFFIDSVDSYRGNNNDGWLQVLFKKLLKEKLDEEIIKNDDNDEYKEFLKQSLNNIDDCCGGYFSKDNKDKDVEKEIDDILKNKNKLISFIDSDGKYVLRRFLFSKWTLKEGWDNPNVFVLAKLRSSGSENSKIQEVGRGLRLPVNENGERVSKEEFRLNYIIDYSEKEFAKKLTFEINSDNNRRNFEGKVTNEIIEDIKNNNKQYENLPIIQIKIELIKEKIIDDNENILDSEKLISLCSNTLKVNKIRNNPKEEEKVKLNTDNWNKIKDLWCNISKRYMIKYEINENDLETLIKESVKDCFKINTTQIYYKNKMSIKEDNIFYEEMSDSIERSNYKTLKYGEFLKKLNKITGVSIFLWHKAIYEEYSSKGIKREEINNKSLMNIINKYETLFIKTFNEECELKTKYKFEELDFNATSTLYKDGNFVKDIKKSLLGNETLEGTIEDNYLYNKKCYDSLVEKDILSINLEDNKKILVFGKLPRKAIRIPTFIGGTTTPDFIYIIKNEDGSIKMNLLVEAKSDENNLRESEKVAINSQKYFFENIKNIDWKIVTNAEEILSELQNI